ncbi:MAG TPA: shikimate dehydrogenase [Chitinophagaceae bacterium]|nr:shikimate dehydrogenase [Chitinophagaceae bacterium]
MDQYGIIGNPLSHSFSPAYFNARFVREGIPAEYTAFPLDSIGLLPGLIAAHPALRGLNVTIPYKTAVIPYLQGLSAAASAINAVNCIRMVEGKLFGFNTDHYGFSESLKPLLQAGITDALVLGTGGSSKAVCYALEQLGLRYHLVSASGNGDYTYADLSETIIRSHLLIVNTTPLGMSPHTTECPDIPYHFLGGSHVLYDLVYNPEETLFLQKGRIQGAQTKNGYEMLLLQADQSWAIWNSGDVLTEFSVSA